MMKNLYVIPLLLVVAALSLPFESHAENFHDQKQNELQDINQKIGILEKKLAAMRKDALNQEIKAQPYMFDNWQEFAEDIRITEQDEQNIQVTKKRLIELNKRKDNLKLPPNNLRDGLHETPKSV